jgi:acetyl esterase/lipase
LVGYDPSATSAIQPWLTLAALVATPASTAEFTAEIDALLGGQLANPPNSNTQSATKDSLADGFRAISLVRDQADRWHIDPARAGLIGFSAGAIIAVAASAAEDARSRPAFTAAIYPSMVAQDIPSDAPSLFVVLAGDDPLFGRQPHDLIDGWRGARRPVEFHFFERGGHSFGMRERGLPVAGWKDMLVEWITALRETPDLERIYYGSDGFSAAGKVRLKRAPSE